VVDLAWWEVQLAVHQLVVLLWAEPQLVVLLWAEPQLVVLLWAEPQDLKDHLDVHQVVEQHWVQGHWTRLEGLGWWKERGLVVQEDHLYWRLQTEDIWWSVKEVGR
jgi:hypothetical protein